MYKKKADKFPAILDSFLFDVDCIGQLPYRVGGGGPEGGQDGCMKMEEKGIRMR